MDWGFLFNRTKRRFTMPLEQNCSYLRIRLHGNDRLFTSLILVAAGCRVLLLPPPDPLPKGRGSLAAHAGGFAYLNRLCQTYRRRDALVPGDYRRRDAFAGGLLYALWLVSYIIISKNNGSVVSLGYNTSIGMFV